MSEHKSQGVEVHYMDKGFSCFQHDNEGTLYLRTDEDGHHQVDAADVTSHIVAEWLDSTGRTDLEICNDVWHAMNTGTQHMMGVRSMMVGDTISIQTNNRGPKREYVVASFGFERVS